MFATNPHYQAIADYYGNRRTKRSGVLYLQHIDHGLIILDAIGATLKAKEAYCLHPIVQGDRDRTYAVGLTFGLAAKSAKRSPGIAVSFL